MNQFNRARVTGGHAGYEIAPLVPSLEALLWAAMSAGAPAPGLNTVKHHDMCTCLLGTINRPSSAVSSLLAVLYFSCSKLTFCD